MVVTAKRKIEKILVIDDEPDITFSLKHVLEENRFASVDIFNDPAEVISKYNNQPETMYDLLIIDILMPRMNGFELYERIRKIDVNAKVCFISAYRMYFEALREMYPDYEVDCFMNKPFENEDLLRKVASALTTTIN
jgi:two-component system, OmpR family, response regulator ChvI